MGSSYVIHSKGIFHGLPSFPDDPNAQNLTAIVAGATGISGYQMIKVLAASPRWIKIYALSSRSADEWFYDGLGEGRAKVQHVVVDLLGDPEPIGTVFREKCAKTQASSLVNWYHVDRD
jgi:hypothetical protein